MSADRIKTTAGDLAAALANGTALLESQPAAAALQARAILHAAPTHLPALRLLARALDQLGEHAAAQEARGHALAVGARNPAVGAANRALNEGRHEAVAALLADNLAADPDDPVTLLMLGEAATRSGRFGEAADLLRRALAAAPEYTPARLALARALHRRFDPQAALAVLDGAPANTQDPVALHRFRATLLAELDDYPGAAAVLAQLAAANPGEAALLIQQGDMLRSLGDKAAADAAYRRAIAAAPQHGRAWWALAAFDAAAFSADDIARLAQLHKSAADADSAMHFAFALGRVRDHQADYPAAFALFTQANRLHRQLLPWDAAPFLRRNAALMAAIDGGLITSRAGWGADDPAPIFITGLPRSGSTLIEQMLSRHSQIAAGGEMPVIPALLREAAASRNLDPETDIVALIESFTRADVAALGAEYLRRARQRCGGAHAHFTDKLPHNWAEFAFIRLILPRAQFIDMRRDLADCAMSNFALLFAPGHPASYDLADFAAYAQAYVSMTAAITHHAPGAVVQVRYEELVRAPEPSLRAALGQLGLPFESDCLQFDHSSRAVATASTEQVRRPLSAGSIGSWRRFAPFLGDFPEMLARITPRE